MALKPRYRRVAALDRRFVDRADSLRAFEEELGRVGGRPRVLNVTGVGGIGKSRLLQELRDRAKALGFRTAALDLQVPALRQHEDALAVLRMEFGEQGVSFDRFDIGYAVLWQRLHPHLKFSDADLPFATESEILGDILDEAAGVPVFGTALGLIKLAERAAGKFRKSRRIKLDATLQRLDDLPNTEVVDAVTYLFAQDLRTQSDWSSGDPDCRPYVLLIDAYEALVPTPVRAGRMARADVWLRDLVSQMDCGLVVIASREPLGWETYDSEWRHIIHSWPVSGLPMDARRALLSEAGIVESGDQDAIARASEGLPFYLHLAADTWSGQAVASVISSEEILQRFLLHVSANEIRILELLSVARTFDYDIFRAIGAAFDLPDDRMTWESIIAYSFIYPAGGVGLRLHQLMAKALRQRVSAEVALDVHGTLRREWDGRLADDAVGELSSAVAVAGFREAAYHAVWSGATADEVLAYADDAARCGGTQASSGIVADMREALASSTNPRFAEVALCLEAEAAIRLGDAARAAELTPFHNLPAPDTAAAARVSIAAAHARRIAGDTAEARETYQSVWERHDGVARHTAGIWFADLEMWRGGFVAAFQLADGILEACPPDDDMLRGDTLRLMHLGHRFHVNFADAQRTYEQARIHYERAGTVVGLANIATNYVELLAWTDPMQAISAAPGAIEAQQDLAAQHELGKTHTALAIARMRLGDLHGAAESFDTAADFLDKAGYRSGRARAELFRGFLYARWSDFDKAAESIRWSVSELVAAEVYPTLVLVADHVLEQLELADPEVERAVAKARQQIEALDSLARLEGRISDLVGVMLEEAG